MNRVSSVKKEFNRLSKKGLLAFPEDFYAGEFVRKPDSQGYFSIRDKWYIYRIDEHNNPQITGPFSPKGIIYACAMMLHQTSELEEYRFSEEERSIYIHNHYNSQEDLPD